MQEDALLRKVIRRLDIMIALQIEALGGPEAARPAKKIQRLSELGVTASEIASVLGKPINYITATLSRQKKSSRRKEAKR